MSSISAGVTTGTALVSTGDTTGELVLKTNGTTTAVTIGTDQVVTLAQPLPAASGGTGTTSFPAPGTSGNLLTSNGTAWTSAAAPTPSGVTTFTASGAITAAAPVVLNNSGTVSAISSQTGTNGSRTSVNSTASADPSVVYDTVNNVAVFSYLRFSGSVYQVYAIVASLSGTTFTFGSETLVDSNASGGVGICYDSGSGKVVVTYRRNSNGFPYAAVGTVSGTSISFGTSVAVASIDVASSTLQTTIAESSKTVTHYTSTSGNTPYAVVGTISGTSISFGTAVTMGEASSVNSAACAGVGNSKVVFIYTNGSDFGESRVGTVSGTSISFGTAVVFRSSTTFGKYSITKTETEKFASSFMTSNGAFLTVAGGIVSGTVPSVSSGIVGFGAVTDSFAPLTFIPSLNTVYVSYVGTNLLSYRPIILKGLGGASGDAVTVFSGAYVGSGTRVSLTVSNGGSLISATQNSSDHITAVAVTTPTTSNYPLLIGLANASVSDGASVAVTTFGGTATNQTSLIPNTGYYVNSSGLSASSSSAVLLGKAISSTSMIITGGGS
jgi:hypothetical protein